MKRCRLETCLCLSLFGLLTSSVVVLVSGCGKLELTSGAFAEPSVRIKLADAAPAATKDGNEKVTAVSGAPGTFSGRVVFKGAAPAPKVLYDKGKAPKEAEVCSASGPIMDESLVIGADNGDGKRGIANVFIYLDKPPAGYTHTPPTEPVVFDQRNCTFLTHALVIQVGQPMQIINDDDVPHNTKSSPLKNDPLNATLRKDRTGTNVVYKKSEIKPVPVKCDFHAWMSAFHLPLNHPFATVTDKDGNFKIENLPAGDYQFKIWHEKAEGGKGGYLESKIKVSVKPDMPPVEIVEDAAKFGL